MGLIIIVFCILVPVNEHITSCATEVKISLVANPHNYTEDLINSTLQSYFTNPKYLRKNDIFEVDFNTHLPESKYCLADPNLDVLYYKVNEVKTEKEINNNDGTFAVFGKTTVIQESNVHSYLPRKCFCDMSYDSVRDFSTYWPPAIKDVLHNLQSCIAPFLQKSMFHFRFTFSYFMCNSHMKLIVCFRIITDIYIDVKPVFLVEGPVGSGKSRLIKAAAESMGLHLLEADVAEIQSLTSAQTEAKLRIILNEAEVCVPCVLMLQNIQVRIFQIFFIKKK